MRSRDLVDLLGKAMNFGGKIANITENTEILNVFKIKTENDFCTIYQKYETIIFLQSFKCLFYDTQWR